MHSRKLLLAVVLWPVVACADPPAPAKPAPPLVGLDGFAALGTGGINTVPSKPIPDAKGNAGPAALEKTKLLDPPPPPPPMPGIVR